MSRTEYDVAEPGPDPDPVPSTGPACPHCGGGPLVAVVPLGVVTCNSCARIIRRSA